MNGEVVSSHIKATENTTLAKLTVFDQLKLLIRKFNNDDVAELNAAEKLSGIGLKMKASLTNLFKTAIEEMNKNNHNSVTLSVSSKYIPYIDDVIDKDHGLGRYYDFELQNTDLPINIDYMFIVTIRKKVTQF